MIDHQVEMLSNELRDEIRISTTRVVRQRAGAIDEIKEISEQFINSAIRKIKKLTIDIISSATTDVLQSIIKDIIKDEIISKIKDEPKEEVVEEIIEDMQKEPKTEIIPLLRRKRNMPKMKNKRKTTTKKNLKDKNNEDVVESIDLTIDEK